MGTPESSILTAFSVIFHYKPIHLGVPPFMEPPTDDCFGENDELDCREDLEVSWSILKYVLDSPWSLQTGHDLFVLPGGYPLISGRQVKGLIRTRWAMWYDLYISLINGVVNASI